MSGKRLRKMLLQSAHLDEIVNQNVSQKTTGSHDRNRKTMISSSIDGEEHGYANMSKTKEELESEKEESKIKAQLESILFYDHAFSKRADINHKSVKRRMNEISKGTNKRKKIKLTGQGSGGTFSNSRSSSSYNARKKHEQTFDKRKDAQNKKMRNLRDIARQLKLKKNK